MKSVKPNKIKNANLITQTETKRADTIATTCSFSTNNRRRKKNKKASIIHASITANYYFNVRETTACLANHWRLGED